MGTKMRSRRWGPVVKLTHWSIALAVLANAIFTSEGSVAHVWVGYALAAVLGLRLLWGFIGPAEARFTAFLPSARKTIAHVREIRAGKISGHSSHNPLGALMVYAIWSCLLVIIATGIAMAGLPRSGEGLDERTGAPSGFGVATHAGAPKDKEATTEELRHDEREVERDDRAEGAMGEAHEVAANVLYLLILLHIAGVVFETQRCGRQVALAMLPGHR